MTPKKIIPVFLVLTMLALTACSSTSGGSSQPSDVNVVVPPNNNTVVVPPNSTVVVPPNSKIVSP